MVLVAAMAIASACSSSEGEIAAPSPTTAATTDAPATTATPTTAPAEPTREPAPTTATLPAPTSSLPDPFAPVHVLNLYWLLDGKLVAGGWVEPTEFPARTAVELLLQGVPAFLAEETNHETAIRDHVELLDLTIDDGTAIVDLSSEFEAAPLGPLSEAEELAMVAQVVFTLTQFPSIDTVDIRIAGEERETILSHGLSARGLTRADFADAVAPAIVVERPIPNQSVWAPFQVRGFSRTFESNVQWKLTMRDTEIASGFTTANQRDVGQHGPFEFTVTIDDFDQSLGRLAVDARDPQQVLEQVWASAATVLKADSAVLFLLDSDLLAFRVASGAGLMPGLAPGAGVPNRAHTLPGHVARLGRAVSVPDLHREARFALPTAFADVGLSVALAVPLSDRGRVIGVFVVAARHALRFGDDEQHFVESLCNLLATCLQRAQSEDALKHAQRLETVGQLTGGIAHDFNNLLTIIQGSLQVLQDLPSLADDTQGQKLVASAARAARPGADLTAKLLAFARRQVLQPDALDIGTMLHSLAEMLRRTLDQRIHIEVDVAAGCPAVLADPGQLDAALLNIAINARDAMLEGGTLRFSATAVDSLPQVLRAELDETADAAAGHVAIAIADSGTGMTEAVKRRAFEPFFTTKEAGRGTGLGLSTVYGFVKQSKGALALDSRVGAGTTITLYLPRPPRADPPADSSAAVGSTLPVGLSVLLVEDDADVRAVVQAFLDALGCRTSAFASGEQALLALGDGADFELLLSDIALGAGMRGIELAAAAQRQLPQLAVLLMSGYSAELLQADREAPASWELLRKPFTRDQLDAAIAKLMAAREAAA